MYKQDTILSLKQQQEPDEEGNPFPYNRVKVVGPSPLVHAAGSGSGGEWSGAAAQGVIITPAGDGFGSTLDEPEGKLQQLYDVEYIPPNEVVADPIKIVTPDSGSAGPSPEEVFKSEAPKPEDVPEGQHRRGRTKHSPLDGPLSEAAQNDRRSAKEKIRAGASPLAESDKPDAPNRGADEEFAPEATE